MKQHNTYYAVLLITLLVGFAACKKKASGSLDTVNNALYWSQLGDNKDFRFARGACVCVDKNRNVYATQRSYVSKWNGKEWTATLLPSSNAPVFTLYADNLNNVYAGSSYVSKWDGNAWSALGDMGGLSTDSIYCITGDNAGNIYAATSNSAVAVWNGTDWHYTAQLNGHINSVCCTKTGSLLAGGSFTNANGKYYVALWNGTAWEELGTDANALNANNVINTLTTDNQGNVYAAGTFKNADKNMYVAKWNGTRWQELGGNNSLQANNTIASICSDNRGHIYAAGWFIKNGYRYVAKYNGAAWEQVGPPAVIEDGRYSGNKYPAYNPIYSICVDEENTVYATVFEFISSVINGHEANRVVYYAQ
ncbi:MAG: hypothetical protein KF900_00160 [Bacteroidetes bacterium]|nr:hypothetical protein [Bacteroidota bacterium]